MKGQLSLHLRRYKQVIQMNEQELHKTRMYTAIVNASEDDTQLEQNNNRYPLFHYISKIVICKDSWILHSYCVFLNKPQSFYTWQATNDNETGCITFNLCALTVALVWYNVSVEISHLMLQTGVRKPGTLTTSCYLYSFVFVPLTELKFKLVTHKIFGISLGVSWKSIKNQPMKSFHQVEETTKIRWENPF